MPSAGTAAPEVMVKTEEVGVSIEPVKPGTVDAITCNVVTLSSSARNRMRPPINSLATRDDRPAVASALLKSSTRSAATVLSPWASSLTVTASSSPFTFRLTLTLIVAGVLSR